ncbi:MAG: hypothetical protein EOO08_02345 [Chitinophagaceae bacterium]|nr:MAG: hypothetical protein EOO08_02345 [Chitinophagaceae bacterium]
MNVFIFSRPIRSGKTTELKQWCAGREGVTGILMPDISDERYFESMPGGVQWPLKGIDDDTCTEVGRFRISHASMSRAVDWLSSNRTAGWLVIDEIGRLELRGEGFAPLLSSLLSDTAPGPINLLLVIRATLVDEAIRHFGLEHAHTVSTLNEI